MYGDIGIEKKHKIKEIKIALEMDYKKFTINNCTADLKRML